MKLNSTAELLDEQGQTESLIVDGIAESGTLKDSSNGPESALIKTDSSNRVMFADSTGIQIDSSKMVDTRDGLLVKDAIICRAMVLDYNGKKILKSPEALADSMPTMQDDNGQASAVQGDNGCLGNKRKGSSRNGHTQ